LGKIESGKVEVGKERKIPEGKKWAAFAILIIEEIFGEEVCFRLEKK